MAPRPASGQPGFAAPGSDRGKFTGHGGVAAPLYARAVAPPRSVRSKTMTIATTSPGSGRSPWRLMPLLAAARDRPARLACRVVAFPFCLSDVDAVGSLFRDRCPDRLGPRPAARPRAHRTARRRDRVRCLCRRRLDRVCPLALRPDAADPAADPRHHDRSRQSSRFCRRIGRADRRCREFGRL
jgi:hypothetical protein